MFGKQISRKLQRVFCNKLFKNIKRKSNINIFQIDTYNCGTDNNHTHQKETTQLQVFKYIVWKMKVKHVQTFIDCITF